MGPTAAPDPVLAMCRLRSRQSDRRKAAIRAESWKWADIDQGLVLAHAPGDDPVTNRRTRCSQRGSTAERDRRRDGGAVRYGRNGTGTGRTPTSHGPRRYGRPTVRAGGGTHRGRTGRTGLATHHAVRRGTAQDGGDSPQGHTTPDAPTTTGPTHAAVRPRATRTADRTLRGRREPMTPARQASRAPSYISAIRTSYSCSTTLLLSFRLGVSSPCSTSRSRGSSRNFLMVCQRWSPSLSRRT